MKKSLSLIIMLLIVSILFVGCSDKSDEKVEDTAEDGVVTEKDDTLKDDEEKDEENAKEDVEENVEVKEAKDETPEKEDKESILSNIFSKADKMNEYSYEMDMIAEDGISTTGKLWISNNKTKMEFKSSDGEESVMIMDGEENLSYIYSPVEKSGVKMTYNLSEEEQEQNAQVGSQNYAEIMQEISDDGNVEIEKGTLDGESVDIITGKIEGDTTKMWISRKTGFPLKHESYSEGELQTTILYSNFKAEPIDSSNFTVPDDIELMDMTQ